MSCFYRYDDWGSDSDMNIGNLNNPEWYRCTSYPMPNVDYQMAPGPMAKKDKLVSLIHPRFKQTTAKFALKNNPDHVFVGECDTSTLYSF